MKKYGIPAFVILAALAAAFIHFVPGARWFIMSGTSSMMYPKPPALAEGKTHIACIGDSITYGAGVLDENGDAYEELTWPYYLEEKFDGSVQLLNYGLCGRTLQKEGDYPYTDTYFYPVSRDCRADKYLILLGTNDSKAQNWDAERYAQELEEFVLSYKTLPNNPEVILVTPPHAFVMEGKDAVAYEVQADVIQNEIVPIVKDTAQRLGLRCFDLNEASKDHPEWFGDGVHPNAAGNQEIADFFYRCFEQND